ncbi:Crp/Fnr family transcriptional regulator [Polycladidibacter hongkongensis]|uniref:Crp/Fnr family transcriptional regulator n=1 Tax=Polycladidibacter hongkongensis TaxID=1647556 RepID=UPI00083144BB|nr:Crp/Fnr family transcriptional regulator [Pseudovibrio hongkongensis]
MMKLDPTVLRALAPFAEATEEAISRTMSTGSVRLIAKETAIFDQGAAATQFFALIDGYVRVVSSNAQGEQIIMRYICAGSLFGLAPALDRDTYPASAIAAKDCVLISWPRSCFDEFCNIIPGFAKKNAQTIACRLQDTQARVMELSIAHVEKRVAATLLRLTETAGKPVAEGIEINFQISRQDIAELTGTTLHTVSRLLSAWSSKGYVSTGRKKIIVCNMNALEAMGVNAEI